MKPQLSLTATHVIDLQDQPIAQHVLFVADAVGGSDAFAVDGVRVDRWKVTGWRNATIGLSETVVEVPTGTQWRLVTRASLDMVTVQDVITRRFEDENEMTKLRQTYHKPEPPPKAAERLGVYV